MARVSQGESTGKVFSIAPGGRYWGGGGIQTVPIGCQEGHTAGHRTEPGSLTSEEDPRDPPALPNSTQCGTQLLLRPPQAKPGGYLCGIRL